MPRRVTAPGFTYLGGSSRRYRRDDTGETLSRRQYERQTTGETQYARLDRKAKAAGWSSYSAYRRTSPWSMPKWEKHRAQMLAAGVPPSQLGPISRARRLWQEVDTERGTLPRNAIGGANDHDSALLRDPDGPLAQLLVMMGYRDQDSRIMVGDSPRMLGMAA